MHVHSENSSLLSVKMSTFFSSEEKDILSWAEISKFIKTEQSFIDRSESTKLPIKFRIHETSKLPDFSAPFNKSYYEICLERVSEILSVQERIDKQIALFYSGGIDSTMALLAFYDYMGEEKFRSNVTVFLTPDSVNENPSVYYKYLRNRIKLESATSFRSLFDGSYIIVGAEFNDQLHGSLLLSDILLRYDEDILIKQLTHDFLRTELSQSGMSVHSAKVWFQYFELILERHKNFNIQTVFDFYWFINFIYKWQSVYFRMPLRALRSQQSNINDEYLAQFYHHFFITPDFQRWSVNNPQFRIKDKWKTYKWHVKDLIYNFTKDSNYRDNKIKVGSLINLFQQSYNPIAIDGNYNFHFNVNPMDYYQANNDLILKV